MFLALTPLELTRKVLKPRMNWAYYLWLVNVLLSGCVMGLCFLKANVDRVNMARNTRIVGLGLLCLAIAWGSLARRYESFNPRMPVTTVGLLFCLYGMRRRASGEKRRLRN